MNAPRKKGAGKSCPACAHAARESIEDELRWGASVRSVARAYGLSRSALKRHLSFHETLEASALEEEAG